MRHQVIAISELQSGFQKSSLQGVVVMARFTQDERECGWSPSFLWLLLCICNHSHKFSCFIQHKCVSLNFWPIGWRCIVKGQTRLVHPGGMRRHSMSLPLLPVLLCLLLLSPPVYHPIFVAINTSPFPLPESPPAFLLQGLLWFYVGSVWVNQDNHFPSRSLIWSYLKVSSAI